MENEKENKMNNEEKEEINNLKKLQIEKEEVLNKNIDKEEQDLLQKQKKELNDLITNFDIKIKPKISSYYLDLKVREYFLSRQDKFIQAQETKEKAEKQFIEDNKIIEKEKKIALLKKIEELNEKHRKEYINFIKDKSKKIYLLKKEQVDKQNEIKDKYKNFKEKEVVKNTINNIMKKYKNKNGKNGDIKDNLHKDNPFL